MSILASAPAFHIHFNSTINGLSIGITNSSQNLMLAKPTTPISSKRRALQIWMLKGAGAGQPSGFGLQQKENKSMRKILTLDPAKTAEIQKYDLFARKLTKGGSASEWELIGDILLEKGSDLEMALKERRKKLLAGAQYQYPSFRILNTEEELQYGFRKSNEADDDIALVDVKGKDLGSSVPALLRINDGIKPQPKRF